MTLNEALGEARAAYKKNSDFLSEVGQNLQYIGELLVCKQSVLGERDGNIGQWDYTTIRMLPDGDAKRALDFERTLAAVRDLEKARNDIAQLEKEIDEASKRL